jgi:hypothetical protein
MSQTNENKTENLTDKLEAWLELVKSGALEELFGVFEAHRIYCEKEVLIAVKSFNLNKAIEWRAKAEDAVQNVNMIKDRIKKLKEEVRKDGRE